MVLLYVLFHRLCASCSSRVSSPLTNVMNTYHLLTINNEHCSASTTTQLAQQQGQLALHQSDEVSGLPHFRSTNLATTSPTALFYDPSTHLAQQWGQLAQHQSDEVLQRCKIFSLQMHPPKSMLHISITTHLAQQRGQLAPHQSDEVFQGRHVFCEEATQSSGGVWGLEALLHSSAPVDIGHHNDELQCEVDNGITCSVNVVDTGLEMHSGMSNGIEYGVIAVDM